MEDQEFVDRIREAVEEYLMWRDGDPYIVLTTVGVDLLAKGVVAIALLQGGTEVQFLAFMEDILNLVRINIKKIRESFLENCSVESIINDLYKEVILNGSGKMDNGQVDKKVEG